MKKIEIFIGVFLCWHTILCLAMDPDQLPPIKRRAIVTQNGSQACQHQVTDQSLAVSATLNELMHRKIAISDQVKLLLACATGRSSVDIDTSLLGKICLDSKLLHKLMFFLPFCSCRNLSRINMRMHKRIIEDSNNSTILIAKKLIDDFVDPITYALTVAEGSSVVRLYGFSLNTAELVNYLLSQGCPIARTNLKKLTLISSPWEFPEARCQLHIPDGINMSPEQRFVCKKWLMIEKDQHDSVQTLWEKVHSIVTKNPETPLSIAISHQAVTKDLCLGLDGLKNLIVSLKFYSCQFLNKEETIAQLALLPLLQEIELHDTTFGPLHELFPEEICSCQKLIALMIKSRTELKMKVPKALQTMRNLDILLLDLDPMVETQIDFAERSDCYQHSPHSPRLMSTTANLISLGRINPHMLGFWGNLIGTLNHLDKLEGLGGNHLPFHQLIRLKNLRSLVLFAGDSCVGITQDNYNKILMACRVLKHLEFIDLAHIWSISRERLGGLLSIPYLKLRCCFGDSCHDMENLFTLSNLVKSEKQLIEHIELLNSQVQTPFFREILKLYPEFYSNLLMLSKKIPEYDLLTKFWRRNNITLTDLKKCPKDDPQEFIKIISVIKDNMDVFNKLLQLKSLLTPDGLGATDTQFMAIFSDLLNLGFAKALKKGDMPTLLTALNQGADPSKLDAIAHVANGMHDGTFDPNNPHIIQLIRLILEHGANPFTKIDNNSYNLERIFAYYPHIFQQDLLHMVAGNCGTLSDVLTLYTEIQAYDRRIDNLAQAIAQIGFHCPTCPVHSQTFNNACSLIDRIHRVLSPRLDDQCVCIDRQQYPSIHDLELLSTHKDDVHTSMAQLPGLFADLEHLYGELTSITPECWKFMD